MSVSWYGFSACSLSAILIYLHPFVFLLTEVPFLSRLSSLSLFLLFKPKLENVVQCGPQENFP